MYLLKTPRLIQRLLPGLTWRVPGEEKVLYLTFDDGPIPDVTPWVLEQLRSYSAKATFFCVGENAASHPEILAQLLAEGHSIGNHTYHHLNGWATKSGVYLSDVARCAALVPSPLFRPPYGRLSPRQLSALHPHYRIVMWDVLSADFDPAVSPQQCLSNVLNHAGPGSIIVFHDSLKALSRLRYALPAVLDRYSQDGFSFEALPGGRSF
jgi:peptidoglycan/xylan/chitin deacetylase (PgdA/CDA1 family)